MKAVLLALALTPFIWSMSPAEESRDAREQYYRGLSYIFAKKSDIDYLEGLHWLELAYENGYAPAANVIGDLYDEGKGVRPNPATAHKWYEKAADRGVIEAQFKAGVNYYVGDGCELNPAKAFERFQQAALAGDTRSQYNLGLMYKKGEGVGRDYGRALEWFEKAANQGHKPALFQIGLLYQWGLGVDADPAHALYIYYKPELMLYEPAMVARAHLKCPPGGDAEKDCPQCGGEYKLAALRGDREAQFIAGLLSEYGRCMKRDRLEAAKWYQKSCDNGFAAACKALEKLYGGGR